jgi:hypothetical protein
MLIFGYRLAATDTQWSDDPFADSGTPETEICEACHIYEDDKGRRYIGFELALGMPVSEMEKLLAPYSESLSVISL